MENNGVYNLVPSATESFGFGWRKIFEKNFLPLLLAAIIAGILNGPNVGANFSNDGSFDFNWIFLFPIVIFGLAYSFMFLPVIEYGKQYLYLKAMRNEEPDLKLLFEGFRTKYLNIVLANLIVVALVIFGFMMLIIPGIIVLCRLTFVPYLVMDKNMEPMKAVEKSWEITKGHGWQVFGMAIISFFIVIAGLIFCFVGVFISIMWISSAFATFYQMLLNEQGDENPIPILGVNEV